MPIIAAAPQSLYGRRILQLAFLAPQIQRDILAGRQLNHSKLEGAVSLIATRLYTMEPWLWAQTPSS